MLFQQPTVDVYAQPIIQLITPKKEDKKPEPKLYIIKQGDNLTTIADSYHVTIQRIFDANLDITNPDVIEPSEELRIPEDSETLADRLMPSIIEAKPVVPTPSGFSSSGNTYTPLYCTWYVKDQLSWVQNGWGNASEWKYTSGHKISSTPVVGTVAWAKSYGHVAVVTAIAGGTVTVTEMNYKGLGVISSRQAPISEFEYIYP